ncbi:MAG: ATP-grasp domain-containing protein [Gemmatimonadota bacterium]|nr:ATP-grasp domain-containing protein [Gemmatimonadota bacterium]
MDRLLLLIPTSTYRTHDFMVAAAALDVAVVVGSDRRQALARLTPGKTLALDFARPAASVGRIVAYSKEYPVRAVVGVDDETVVLAAMACEALGIPHNPVSSVRASRYKHVMRRMLAEKGLPSPGFRLFSIRDEPSQAAATVDYPCVLKPVSLSASRGVIRADRKSDFVIAFNRILGLISESVGDLPEAVLVEDYIPGREVALEGLLVDGELHTLALFDKPDPLCGPYFAETLYITPSRLAECVQARIRGAAQRAARALGLTVGPVHAELRLNTHGIHVVEIAARSIGGLCSRVLRFGAGVSLEELILRQATGRDPGELVREDTAAGVMMLPVPMPGTFRSVRGTEGARRVPGILDVAITVPAGQPVQPLPEGDRYLGFIFARGRTPEAVETALREADGRLDVVIED